MEIKISKTENDYLKINNFFWKIWKEEFNLDRFDDLEKYKKYFYEKNFFPPALTFSQRKKEKI